MHFVLMALRGVIFSNPLARSFSGVTCKCVFILGFL